MSNYFNELFKNRTFFIAEIGGNFNDYETGVKLIKLALESGADAVKMQTYKADTLSSKQAMFSSDGMSATGNVSQYEGFTDYQINDKLQKRLFGYAKDNNIMLFSTPSHKTDCEALLEFNNPIYKIGSDDATNLPFIKYIATLDKPILISTGMCTLLEVEEAVNTILCEGNSNICILHCVTNYPADYDSANLRSIKTLQDKFPNIPIGFSDHSPYEELAIAAVTLGSKVIEKHFTYDKNAVGPDHAISLLPEEFLSMVKKVRMVETALGDGIKKPSISEKTTRKNNRKSIVMTKSLTVGSVITKDSVDIKRPGYGIEPKYIDLILGKVIQKDILNDDVLSWDYFN